MRSRRARAPSSAVPSSSSSVAWAPRIPREDPRQAARGISRVIGSDAMSTISMSRLSDGSRLYVYDTGRMLACDLGNGGLLHACTGTLAGGLADVVIADG